MGLVQDLYDWQISEGPSEVQGLVVVVQDTTGAPAGQDSAGRVNERYTPDWLVLGDHEGTWLDDWGALDGTNQHTYALLDEDGRLLWRRADGGSTSVDEVDAVCASEL